MMLVLVLTALGQEPNYEGRTITAIEFSPREQPLAAEDLARAQTMKVGSPFRAQEAGTAIDQLFATGRYRDIQVEAEPSGNGVLVRFVTTNQQFIGHVGLAGKIPYPPNRGQVISTAQLNVGAPFSEADLRRAEANIKRLLSGNGLREADVRTETVNDPVAQQLHFTFVVTPGKRARYAPPVIRGETKLPEKTIIRATGWKWPLIGKWREVTRGRTQAGIQGIQQRYRKQDRLTTSVHLDSLDYDPATRRLKPTVTIQAGPKVEVRTVEAKVPKRKLRRYVPIYQVGAVDRDLLVEGARNLRDYFQSNGYPSVQVDFRQLPPDNDKLIIEYIISKGPKRKLAEVTIQGNRYFTTETLRERMFLEASSFQFRNGRYSEAMRSKDEDAIRNLYQSNGFTDVQVTSNVQENFEGKADRMAVTFNIVEGQQYLVDELSLSGVSQEDAEALRPLLSSSAGQPFSEVSIAADRTAILNRYFVQGYSNASFEWTSTPAGEPNRVNVKYVIREGEQQFVRDVIVLGRRITKEALVDRQITIEPGKPLSTVEIAENQRRLYDLGVFARVTAAIQNPDGETQHKYVVYDFEEASRYRLSAGIGAELARFGGTTTSLSAPSGATGFSPRVSLDLSRLNFLGRGHTVSVRGRISNLQQRASIDYLAPRFQNVEGRNITFTALYDNSRDVRTFSSKRQEASVQVSQQLSKASTALFRFAYRRVSVGDVVIPTLLVPQLLQPIRLGILSANFVQDRRDNSADAHRGIYNTIDVGLASNVFGSQRSFVRALGRNATYHRLGKNLVLARQLTFGAILPYNAPAGLGAAESVPLPERFFGGGSTTHRGFPENQAGPRDIGTPAGPGAEATQPTGFPLGGNALFFNNTELRFPLLGDNIQGVAFHDMGNIYRSLSDLSFRFRQRNDQDFNYMVHAAGFGVRYRTPIGPVRVDLAYSVNPPTFVGFKGTVQELLVCNPNNVPATGVCQGVRQNTSHFQFFFSIGQTF